ISRFIDADGTIRYSTGRPGRENAPAVADPPANPISPGRAAATRALAATRRIHLPRNFSNLLITATNPPFQLLDTKQLPFALRAPVNHQPHASHANQHGVRISLMANDCDSARTRWL